MTVVYADLVLIMNVILDATLLMMTARMRGLRMSRWRFIGSIAIGTGYCSLLFFPIVPIALTLAGKLLVSICMLIVAFGYMNLGFILRNMLVFYFSAFVIAGGAFGIQYLIQDASLWSMSSTANDSLIQQQLKLGAGMLLLALFIAVWSYRVVWKQQQASNQISSFLVDITIGIGDTVKTCRGLIDTGNALKEPLTGAPVMITNASLWQDVLPARWLHAAQQKASWETLAQLTADQPVMNESECEDRAIDEARLRLLPYRGVNQGTQWMIGFKPDYIQIIHESRTYECTRVIIGLDSGQLSRDEKFHAILHPDLIAAQFLKPEAAGSSASIAS